MKLETALKSPRTVTQLMKLCDLSRGGVLSGLKRLKAKKAGKAKRAKSDSGPTPTRYVARGKAARARKLPRSPAARLEAVGELVHGGYVTPEQAAKLLDASEATEAVGALSAAVEAACPECAATYSDTEPTTEVETAPATYQAPPEQV